MEITGTSKSGCNAMSKCDPAEENNCSGSGMISEEENHMDLNLELSIGLLDSRRSFYFPPKNPTKPLIFNVAESNLQHIPGVCLCCQLGSQSQRSDEPCRNCQNTDGFFRPRRHECPVFSTLKMSQQTENALLLILSKDESNGDRYLILKKGVLFDFVLYPATRKNLS
ncbi:hypothetical protein SAY87_020803 [Trapa incisa]|uniref:Uncharacterized protein n=1 Tax=Trapa incisa TaxID=236973 RepID=A0AAN7JR55_9MYRT|nr:hypothetical protein SAY87_020803 [Trapa incisa]